MTITVAFLSIFISALFYISQKSLGFSLGFFFRALYIILVSLKVVPVMLYALLLFAFYLFSNSVWEHRWGSNSVATPPDLLMTHKYFSSSPSIVAICHGPVRCNNSTSHFRTSESHNRSLSAATVPKMSQLLRPPQHAGTPTNIIMQCWWTEAHANVKVQQWFFFFQFWLANLQKRTVI